MKEIKSTAITEWFRKSKMLVPSHFNQSMVFRCAKRLNSYALKSTMRMLCCYHEVLCAFWNGEHLVARDVTCLKLVLVEEYDFRRSTDVNADMLPIVERLQSTIDLSNGPLVHVGHFRLPEYDAVFMTIHHLAVDGVSWRIIAEDINSIYTQVSSGEYKIRLPRIRCTFADYADGIHAYAQSEELTREVPYWEKIAADVKNLTDDLALSRVSAMVPLNVDKDVTQRVLTECIGKYGVEVNDLLLTAVSRAWKKVTGQDRISLSMEGHGREPFGAHPLELERIVGWFTIMYPVLVDGTIEDIEEHVQQTAAMMHAIPNKGFGYGILLHIARKDDLGCTPQMTFNYLGSFEEGGSSDQVFSIDKDLPKGSDINSLNMSGGVPLSINCLTVDGSLVGSLEYDISVLSEEKAQALVREFAAQLSLL